ncbi:immunoglobulin iota chain [Thomomys bottae]
MTGGDPQLTLHQPPFASSPLGTTIRLTCTLNSNHNIGVYSIFWYQQRPGHPPRFLMRYFSPTDKYLGPQLPSRFSGSKDMIKNRAYLTISELEPEDEAMYYCAIGTRSFEKQNDIERERRDEKDEDAGSGSQTAQEMQSLHGELGVTQRLM